MIIKQLSLVHFRNYQKLNIHFDSQLNVIVGQNAQGKTNLLESLYYASLTRSFRLQEDEKLIQYDQSFAQIKCLIEKPEKKEIKMILSHLGKSLFLNGVPIKKTSELIGMLNVVLFSPDDLTIFTDSPSVRRKLLNQELTKISKKYFINLNQYQILLKNRNALLKKDKIDEIYLKTLDEKMIALSKNVIESRTYFFQFINQLISKIYQKLSKSTDIVKVEYLCCVNQIDELNQLFELNRKKDMDYQMTTSGIHREDMRFLLNDKSVDEIASQGQRRMIVLAFKLSLLKFIESIIHDKPVLLLDDVLSELDEIRQLELFDVISKDYQCFITTTTIPKFLNRYAYKKIEIKNGEIYTGGTL